MLAEFFFFKNINIDLFVSLSLFFSLLFGTTRSEWHQAEPSFHYAGFFLAATLRLSCLTTCGILVSCPGIEPMSPALEGEFLTPGPRGKSPCLLLTIAFMENSG